MRLVWGVLAVCVLGGVARANDPPSVVAPPEKIIGRGALTVTTGGDETHHYVFIRDQHGHSIDLILSDPVVANRATVMPFFGERGLYHVTVFIDDAHKPYHVEHHYLVRTGQELQLTCQFEGNVTVPPDPVTQVTVRKASSRPLQFDVDTRREGSIQRARYTIPPGELCNDPVTVAATAPGEEARIVAAMHARKYRGVQVLGLAGPGSFVALGVLGKVDEPKEELVLVTPAAKPPILVLGESGPHNERDGVRVLSYGPFLDSKVLHELKIDVTWSNGFGGSSSATHYILRRAPGPQLACVLFGSSSGGMEDVNHSSSVSFAKISDDPLTFRISHTESEGQIGLQGIGGGPAGEPCVIPARGMCKCGVVGSSD